MNFSESFNKDKIEAEYLKSNNLRIEFLNEKYCLIHFNIQNNSKDKEKSYKNLKNSIFRTSNSLNYSKSVSNFNVSPQSQRTLDNLSNMYKEKSKKKTNLNDNKFNFKHSNKSIIIDNKKKDLESFISNNNSNLMDTVINLRNSNNLESLYENSFSHSIILDFQKQFIYDSNKSSDRNKKNNLKKIRRLKRNNSDSKINKARFILNSDLECLELKNQFLNIENLKKNKLTNSVANNFHKSLINKLSEKNKCKTLNLQNINSLKFSSSTNNIHIYNYHNYNFKNNKLKRLKYRRNNYSEISNTLNFEMSENHQIRSSMIENSLSASKSTINLKKNSNTSIFKYFPKSASKSYISNKSVFYSPSTICNYYQHSNDVTPSIGYSNKNLRKKYINSEILGKRNLNKEMADCYDQNIMKQDYFITNNNFANDKDIKKNIDESLLNKYILKPKNLNKIDGININNQLVNKNIIIKEFQDNEFKKYPSEFNGEFVNSNNYRNSINEKENTDFDENSLNFSLSKNSLSQSIKNYQYNLRNETNILNDENFSHNNLNIFNMISNLNTSKKTASRNIKYNKEQFKSGDRNSITSSEKKLLSSRNLLNYENFNINYENFKNELNAYANFNKSDNKTDNKEGNLTLNILNNRISISKIQGNYTNEDFENLTTSRISPTKELNNIFEHIDINDNKLITDSHNFKGLINNQNHSNNFALENAQYTQTINKYDDGDFFLNNMKNDKKLNFNNNNKDNEIKNTNGIYEILFNIKNNTNANDKQESNREGFFEKGKINKKLNFDNSKDFVMEEIFNSGYNTCCNKIKKSSFSHKSDVNENKNDKFNESFNLKSSFKLKENLGLPINATTSKLKSNNYSNILKDFSLQSKDSLIYSYDISKNHHNVSSNDINKIESNESFVKFKKNSISMPISTFHNKDQLIINDLDQEQEISKQVTTNKLLDCFSDRKNKNLSNNLKDRIEILNNLISEENTINNSNINIDTGNNSDLISDNKIIKNFNNSHSSEDIIKENKSFGKNSAKNFSLENSINVENNFENFFNSKVSFEKKPFNFDKTHIEIKNEFEIANGVLPLKSKTEKKEIEDIKNPKNISQIISKEQRNNIINNLYLSISELQFENSQNVESLQKLIELKNANSNETFIEKEEKNISNEKVNNFFPKVDIGEIKNNQIKKPKIKCYNFPQEKLNKTLSFDESNIYNNNFICNSDRSVPLIDRHPFTESNKKSQSNLLKKKSKLSIDIGDSEESFKFNYILSNLNISNTRIFSSPKNGINFKNNSNLDISAFEKFIENKPQIKPTELKSIKECTLDNLLRTNKKNKSNMKLNEDCFIANTLAQKNMKNNLTKENKNQFNNDQSKTDISKINSSQRNIEETSKSNSQSKNHLKSKIIHTTNNQNLLEEVIDRKINNKFNDKFISNKQQILESSHSHDQYLLDSKNTKINTKILNFQSAVSTKDSNSNLDKNKFPYESNKNPFFLLSENKEDEMLNEKSFKEKIKKINIFDNNLYNNQKENYNEFKFRINDNSEVNEIYNLNIKNEFEIKNKIKHQDKNLEDIEKENFLNNVYKVLQENKSIKENKLKEKRRKKNIKILKLYSKNKYSQNYSKLKEMNKKNPKKITFDFLIKNLKFQKYKNNDFFKKLKSKSNSCTNIEEFYNSKSKILNDLNNVSDLNYEPNSDFDILSEQKHNILRKKISNTKNAKIFISKPKTFEINYECEVDKNISNLEEKLKNNNILRCFKENYFIEKNIINEKNKSEYSNEKSDKSFNKSKFVDCINSSSKSNNKNDESPITIKKCFKKKTIKNIDEAKFQKFFLESLSGSLRQSKKYFNNINSSEKNDKGIPTNSLLRSFINNSNKRYKNRFQSCLKRKNIEIIRITKFDFASLYRLYEKLPFSSFIKTEKYNGNEFKKIEKEFIKKSNSYGNAFQNNLYNNNFNNNNKGEQNYINSCNFLRSANKNTHFLNISPFANRKSENNNIKPNSENKFKSSMLINTERKLNNINTESKILRKENIECELNKNLIKNIQNKNIFNDDYDDLIRETIENQDDYQDNLCYKLNKGHPFQKKKVKKINNSPTPDKNLFENNKNNYVNININNIKYDESLSILDHKNKVISNFKNYNKTSKNPSQEIYKIGLSKNINSKPDIKIFNTNEHLFLNTFDSLASDDTISNIYLKSIKNNDKKGNQNKRDFFYINEIKEDSNINNACFTNINQMKNQLVFKLDNIRPEKKEIHKKMREHTINNIFKQTSHKNFNDEFNKIASDTNFYRNNTDFLEIKNKMNNIKFENIKLQGLDGDNDEMFDECDL